MQKILYTILLLLVGSAAMAQQMPERREVRRGNSLYNKGEYNAATERYERAARLAPEQFEPLYNLGNALYKAERYEAAEVQMLKAAADTLRTAEERAEALYNLGNVQFRQKKYKEALESYRNSLRLNPSDMEAKYNYAYTKRLLEQQNQQNDQNKDQNKEQNQDRQQQQQPNPENRPENEDNSEEQQGDGGDESRDEGQEKPQDGDQKPEDGEGNEQREGEAPVGTLTEEEAEQILDAIQAQEDKTQEKLKEKHGVVVKGAKNW